MTAEKIKTAQATLRKELTELLRSPQNVTSEVGADTIRDRYRALTLDQVKDVLREFEFREQFGLDHSPHSFLVPRDIQRKLSSRRGPEKAAWFDNALYSLLIAPWFELIVSYYFGMEYFGSSMAVGLIFYFGHLIRGPDKATDYLTNPRIIALSIAHMLPPPFFPLVMVFHLVHNWSDPHAGERAMQELNDLWFWLTNLMKDPPLAPEFPNIIFFKKNQTGPDEENQTLFP